MKKNQTIADFDEASSSSGSEDGSSDSESSSSVPEEEEEEEEENAELHDDSSSSNDDEEVEDDDQYTSSSGEDPAVKQSTSRDEVLSASDDEEASDDNDDETDLPLSERIRLRDAKGSSLQKKRERKRNALEVASERLAKFKKAKKEGNEHSLSVDNDDVQDGEPKKKKSKHAPTEVSSKRSDFYRRGAPRLNESGVGVEIGAHRYKPLDPRTSSMSGHLNQEQFDKNYEFLQEMRNKEISQLKKQIEAQKLTGKKGKRVRRRLNVSVSGGNLEEDEHRLRQLKQEKADFARRKVERVATQSVKRKIRDEVEEGKRGAFFLKRKEKKQLEFEAKIQELKKNGGKKAAEKALAKRRRKAKSRDAVLFAK